MWYNQIVTEASPDSREFKTPTQPEQNLVGIIKQAASGGKIAPSSLLHSLISRQIKSIRDERGRERLKQLLSAVTAKEYSYPDID